MSDKKKAKTLDGYYPRRCDRCWYRDAKDGTCHGCDPGFVWGEEVEDHPLKLVWPYTEPDSFCRRYFPRAHAEREPQSQALPKEVLDQEKKRRTR